MHERSLSGGVFRVMLDTVDHPGNGNAWNRAGSC